MIHIVLTQLPPPPPLPLSSQEILNSISKDIFIYCLLPTETDTAGEDIIEKSEREKSVLLLVNDEEDC